MKRCSDEWLVCAMRGHVLMHMNSNSKLEKWKQSSARQDLHF